MPVHMRFTKKKYVAEVMIFPIKINLSIFFSQGLIFGRFFLLYLFISLYKQTQKNNHHIIVYMANTTDIFR